MEEFTEFTYGSGEGFAALIRLAYVHGKAAFPPSRKLERLRLDGPGIRLAPGDDFCPE
jgi:hypothetical protein